MVVFDPLAILLIVAAQTTYYSSGIAINKTYKKLKEKVDSNEKDEPKVTEGKKTEPPQESIVIEPQYEEDLDDEDDLDSIIESESQAKKQKVWKTIGNTSDNTRRS